MNNEIVKALEKFHERITKTNLSYHIFEDEIMSIVNALELISHQKAEIERLKKYDEERDIRLHAKLIDTARTEALNDFVLTVKRADPCCNSMLLDEIKERMLKNYE